MCSKIVLKKMSNVHITCPLQEGEQFVKKIGGVFAFKIKDGPGGKEATWVVDVKNGKGSVAVNSGQCYFVMLLQKMNKMIVNVKNSCSTEVIVMLNKTGVSVTLAINFSEY